MIHSIQYFEEKGIQIQLLSFAQELIGETLTDCNDMLKNSAKRRNAWHIVRTD